MFFLKKIIKKFIDNMLAYNWQRVFLQDPRYIFLQDLYRHHNGFLISKQERQVRDAVAYLYGEIDFRSFYAVLTCCNINEETIFCDLGCGIGKPTALCALYFPVKKSIGVEKFFQLYNVAQNLKECIYNDPSFSKHSEVIEYYNMDLLDFDLTQCNLVLINIIGLIPEDQAKLIKKLELLSAGSQVITLAKPIVNDNFKIQRVFTVPMSWGLANLYLNLRLSIY